MEPTPNQTDVVALVFKSQAELNIFKRDCDCAERYIDKDFVTIVGTFTNAQLLLATGVYNAMASFVRDPVELRSSKLKEIALQQKRRS